MYAKRKKKKIKNEILINTSHEECSGYQTTYCDTIDSNLKWTNK